MFRKIINLSPKLSDSQVNALFISLGVLLMGLPVYDYIGRKEFVIHLTNPLGKSSLLTILYCYFIPFVAAIFLSKYPRLAKTIIFLGFFVSLRVHGVDLPFVMALLTVGMIILLGHVALRVIGVKEPSLLTYTVYSFLAGISCVVVFSAALSLFYLMVPAVLLGVYVSGGMVGCVSFNWKILIEEIRAWFASEQNDHNAILSLFLLLIGSLAMLTNASLGGDTLWYGIGTEYRLAGTGNMFDGNGLFHYVHYYPKLKEIISLPLTLFPDYSYLLSFNIIILIFIAVVLNQILLTLNFEKKLAWAVALATASIPAICQYARTAKPDTLGILLFAIGVYLFLKMFKEDNRSYAFPAITSLLLATGAKATFLGYSPVLILVVALFFFINKGPEKEEGGKKSIDYRLLTFSMLVVGAWLIVTSRTLWLTGFPYVGNYMVDYFKVLGFESSNDFVIYEGTFIPNKDAPSAMKRLVDLFFFPTTMPSQVFTWISIYPLLLVTYGVLLTFSFIPAGISLQSRMRKIRYGLFPVAAVGLYLMLGMPYLQYGGDGSYFSSLVIVALVIASTIIGIKELKKVSVSIIYVFSVLFVSFHIILNVFACGNFGFHEDDWTLRSNTFDSPVTYKKFNDYAKISEIADMFQSRVKAGGSCEVLIETDRGDKRSGLLKTAALLLPCRTETVDAIKWPVRGRPLAFSNNKSAANYVCQSKVNYLLMPVSNSLPSLGAFVENKEYGGKLVYENDTWKLYNVEHYKNNCT